MVSKVKLCKTFLQNLRGLMFSRKLKDSEAILLDCRQESILHSSIHMLFVFQSIDAVWLNKDLEIVDIQKNLKPFSLFHKPKEKARYVLELKDSALFKEGMQLSLKNSQN
ncbi:DUF192 domain-containing protein [Candidatus Woesearchaeota archaeon]|nr:DUF192 domain-containing protein [Candidatus Woesearchaeota archaeon]